mgnify:CR=1 FL=1
MKFLQKNSLKSSRFAWVWCILVLFLACQNIEKNVAVTKPEEEEFRIMEGDFLFQDLDCGELCDAIEKVTGKVDGKSFSHVGLVVRRGDSLAVAEAIEQDVHYTQLKAFLERNVDSTGKYKIYVGRLAGFYQPLIPRAASFIHKQKGTAYDDAFIYDNGKYYCSELIYDAFQFAFGGKPFFELSDMTYKDPDTGEIFPPWVEYFKALNTEIPEGLPGCNPNSIARDSKIKIVKKFY